MTPEVKEVLLLRVQPGDAIVLRVGHSISEQEAARLKEQWTRAFQGTAMEQAKLIILDGGGDVRIIRHFDESAELTEIARDSFKKAQHGSSR